MLFASMGALERCVSDKEKISVICPSIWIHYVVDGRGYYNGCSLGAGQAFIVYKNDICEYFPHKEDPWTYVWLRLEGEDEENLLQRCALPQSSGVFTFDYKERLCVLAKALFGDNSGEITNRLFGESAAKMILSLNSDSVVDEPYPKDESWVVRAKAYIAANYHRRLKVEQIALELHIDRQYLRNLFVKYTGMPTKAYLDSYRMTKAAELLKLKGSSIYMVALSVGYSDQLAFSKAFKKHFGIPPREYLSEFEQN